MKAVVSVIIPWCNTDVDLLIQSVKSAANQTYGQVEIVICNDGSTIDKREDLLINSRHIRDNLIIIDNEQNEGIPIARNRSVAASSGSWLVWLDADDILEKKCVSRLLDAAIKNNKEMIVGECVVCENSHVSRRRPKIYYDLAKKYFRTVFDPFMLNVISVQPQIISRDAFYKIGEFNTDYDSAEMTEFFLRFIVKRGLDKLGFIEDAIYFYNRKQESSVSTNRDLLFKYRKKALLYYKQQLNINVDDINYLGRSSNTGMQSYLPVIDNKTVIPDYMNIIEHQISIGG